jgi:hypothetical protein
MFNFILQIYKNYLQYNNNLKKYIKQNKLNIQKTIKNYK